LCSSRELCQEELFYLAKGSLTSTFQVCSTYSEIHIKEIIMPNASISRAHVLLQLRRREKSEELLNLLRNTLSLQGVSFITSLH
jgi:hypothetical protein